MSLINRMEAAQKEGAQNEQLVREAQNRAAGELHAMENKISEAQTAYNAQLKATGSNYSLSLLYKLREENNTLVRQYKALKKLYKSEFEGVKAFSVNLIKD